MAIEVKRSGGRGPTRLQHFELGRIEEAWGVAFVARSHDEVDEVLNLIDTLAPVERASDLAFSSRQAS